MSTKIITEIVESLKDNFDENALQIIERTLYKALKDKEIIDVVKTQPQSNEEALVSFLAAKKIEGCSSRSIAFYQTTLQKMFAHITKIYYSVTTEDIRLYLSNYQCKFQPLSTTCTEKQLHFHGDSAPLSRA